MAKSNVPFGSPTVPELPVTFEVAPFTLNSQAGAGTDPVSVNVTSYPLEKSTGIVRFAPITVNAPPKRWGA